MNIAFVLQECKLILDSIQSKQSLSQRQLNRLRSLIDQGLLEVQPEDSDTST